MKTIIKNLTFFFLIFSQIAFAQKEEILIDNLDLQVLPLSRNYEIPSSAYSKTNQKINGFLSRNGVINTIGSTFQLKPSLEIMERGKIEGITKAQTVKVVLTLELRNQNTATLLHAFSKTLTGTGSNRNAAVTNAISSIKSSHSVYKNYVKELRKKVSTYYDNQCDDLIKEADTALSLNQYRKAISLLYGIPSSSTCHPDAHQKLLHALKAQQAKQCQKYMDNAKNLLAQNEYKKALHWVSYVDHESPCATDAQTLVNQIGQEIDAQSQDKIAFLKLVYEQKKEANIARQDIMRRLAEEHHRK